MQRQDSEFNAGNSLKMYLSPRTRLIECFFWFHSFITNRMCVGFLYIMNNYVFAVLYFSIAFTLHYISVHIRSTTWDVTTVGRAHKETSNQVFTHICPNLHTSDDVLNTSNISASLALVLFSKRFCFPRLPLLPLFFALSLSPFSILLPFPRSRRSS